MPVRIRLTRRGRKKQPLYHIVVADSRAPRDGKYIEKLGMYNPTTKPPTIDLDFDKALDWVQKGALPTDTCRSILSQKGVMLKKHLLRGVRKNAISEDEAERKFNEWLTKKQEKVKTEREAELNKQQEEEKQRLEAEKKISDARAEELAKKNAEAAEEDKAEAEEQKETGDEKQEKSGEPEAKAEQAEPQSEESSAAEKQEESGEDKEEGGADEESGKKEE
ncbi:MAG: 30S ribosomal protein S16 [Bacteroidota bacterium]